MITYNRIRTNLIKRLEDQRIRSYSQVILTLLTVIVLIGFALRPIIVKLSTEQGQYGQLVTENQQLETNISTLVTLENTYSTVVQGKDDALQTALPLTPETGPLFANIYAIASGDQVQVSSVKFISSTDTSITQLNLDLYAIPTVQKTGIMYFIMSGTGTYATINKYISDLENYPRVFNFLNINFTGGDTATSEHFSLTGYVYYLSEPS